MNFVDLIAHGLGAMSVFSDLIFVRMLFASSALLLLIVIGVIAAIGIRLFTDLAIPGWATNMVGFLVLLGFNAVMLTVMMAFLQLNRRASLQPVPRDYAMGFVREMRVFAKKSSLTNLQQAAE